MVLVLLFLINLGGLGTAHAASTDGIEAQGMQRVRGSILDLE
jgi:hypothetical protein